MYELHFVDPALPGAPVIHLCGRRRFRFHSGELHFHGCPECYEDGPCASECEVEFDLFEEGEPQRGSHSLCDACRLFPPLPAVPKVSHE